MVKGDHAPLAPTRLAALDELAPLRTVLLPRPAIMAFGLHITRAVAASIAANLPVLRHGVPCSVLCGCDRSPNGIKGPRSSALVFEPPRDALAPLVLAIHAALPDHEWS